VRYILPACSRRAGHHVDQTFAILDMKGALQGGRAAGAALRITTLLPRYKAPHQHAVVYLIRKRSIML
jgi:hypothetical protein